MKLKVFLFLVTSLLAYKLSAQTIQSVSGSFCIGSGSTFILNGASCSSFSWSISSGVNGVDYNYSSNTSSSFNISWIKPLSNFYISCSYASCDGSGGTAYSSTLTINTNAPKFTVGGGGSYCSGGNGVNVTLSGSQNGVSYQLKLNNANSGTAIAGTGSGLTWANQKEIGNYTVTASTCPQDMSGGVSVTVNPLPSQFTVGSGGTYCIGGSGVNVTLSGSQTGVNYQLKVNGNSTTMAGTGSALTWSNQTTTGTYTVTATYPTTSCSQPMKGSADVSVTNILPAMFGIEKIAGDYCGVIDVQLTGSQSGVNYQLKVDGANVPISPVPGGSIPLNPVSWKNLINGGTYTVVANDPTTQCSQVMGGSVIMNPFPVQFIVRGGGSYCVGGTGVNVTLTGSQTGVNYQLKVNGNSTTMAGTGSALTWGNQTTLGTYTVTATYATTGCSQPMRGSADVSITNILPAMFGIEKIAGDYCGAIDVQLTGSQAGVDYQLKVNGTDVPISAVPGGSIPLNPMSWKNLMSGGVYTVVANDPTTQCSQVMGGSVILNPFPDPYIVSGGGTYCLNESGVDVILRGSQIGVNYQLKVNGNSTIMAGTGGTLTWGNQTTVGTYTVTATYTTTGCSQPMRGRANVSVNNILPAMFGISGGGCCGQINVSLNGSQSGTDYQLLINSGNAPISALPGTGTSLAWNNLNVEGTYTVRATSTETGCSQIMGGHASMNIARPIANAGPDKNINLPANSLILNGLGSDLGGTVASYQWTKISGPQATLGNMNVANLFLSGLTSGSYVFQLIVTDNLAEHSLPDQVIVTVINNYNWIRETTILVDNRRTEADVEASVIQDGQKNINWTYFDGLGRPIQSTSVRGSPLGKDIVQPIAYDKFGRENKKYLPYVSSKTDGRLEVDALKDPASSASLDELVRYKTGAHYQFYQLGGTVATDQAPYAETVFEPSQLNYVIKQGAPGLVWQPDPDPANISDRTIKHSNETNAGNEIGYFTYDSTTGLIINGYYEASQLYTSKTKDEHNNEVIEYADKEGHTICKKVQYGVDTSSSKILYASTYYIYNDFGNLIVVLPPEATKTLLQE